MNSQLQSLQSANPQLYSTLLNHPEIKVVDCYFQLESLQFHTLWRIVEKLLAQGFTRPEISEAMKIYMEA